MANCRTCKEICKETGAKPKVASFNIVGERPRYCKVHKSDDMIDTNPYHIKCAGCHKKRPNFNLPGEKALYCKDCKTKDMIDVVNTKKCKGCDKKRPNFNFPGKEAEYCKDCSTEGMVDVNNKQCLFNGCIVAPYFNLQDEKGGVYCNKHAPEGYVDVCNKKCIKCNKKRPSYNILGLQPQYCKDCKTYNMVDVNNKKCSFEDCMTIPSFNLSGEKSGIYCSIHAPDGYVNVHILKCLDCDTSPSYNEPGNKVGIYCAAHAKPNMINVKNPVCKLCTLFQVRPNMYEHLCYTCYIGTHPDEPIARNFLVKEKHIVDFIKELYPNFGWEYNQFINSCAHYRPDLLVYIKNYVIIIEIDEFQHKQKNYVECEAKRINDILYELAQPLIVLRINPDSYKDEKKNIQKGMFIKDKNNKCIVNNSIWNEQKELIKSTLHNIINNKPDQLLTEIKLFFDKC